MKIQPLKSVLRKIPGMSFLAYLRYFYFVSPVTELKRKMMVNKYKKAPEYDEIKKLINQLFFEPKGEKIIPIVIPTDKDKMLEGKIALITGGSSGIGFSMAEEFIKSGAKVIIAGTNEEKLKNCIIKLGEDKAKSIVIDVRNIEKLQEKVNIATQLFEENRIDILVNSAGVITKNGFMNMTEEEYDNVMDINAKGTYFMSQAVSKLMIEKI